METLFNYLLESSLILGVLTMFYCMALHNEPLYRFNRLYLLISLLLAAVLPFVHLSLFQVSDADQVNRFAFVLDSINVYSGEVRQTIVPVIMGHRVFNWVYFVGAVLLFIRLMYGFARLGGLSRKANWLVYKGYRIADLPGRFNPFSFFHIIFMNRSMYSDDDLDNIMVHEMAHVQFKHSLDVILIEALLIVQWFNPFAWIIRHLLKELHEFQADKEVLAKGTSIGQYKMLLLFQATGARLLPVNNFNQSITKKRFKMMNNNSYKSQSIIKSLLAVAIMAGISLFFACDNDYLNETENEVAASSQLKSDQEESEILEPVFFVVEKMPEFPRGEMELRKYIAQNIKYPVEAQEKGIQGRVYVKFVVSKTGKVIDVKIARGIHETIDKEAIRVVTSMPDWIPGMQRGENVNVQYTIPINFVLQGDKVKEAENLNPKVVYINGEKKSLSDLNNLDPKILNLLRF